MLNVFKKLWNWITPAEKVCCLLQHESLCSKLVAWTHGVQVFRFFFCYEGSKAQSTQKLLPRASGTSSPDPRTPFWTDFLNSSLKSPKISLFHAVSLQYVWILRDSAKLRWKGNFWGNFHKKKRGRRLFLRKNNHCVPILRHIKHQKHIFWIQS